MLPVIALVGRPNVGKSTLFNCLTRTRDALVANQPGLTRDRQYGVGLLGERSCLFVDTGGLSDKALGLDALMTHQALRAVEEADLVLFLVDGRAGLTASDEEIGAQLRRTDKPVVLVVNKIDHVNTNWAASEFYRLGLGEPQLIAAVHGRGISALIERVVTTLGEQPLGEGTEAELAGDIRVAFVGRPNVGKSTLLNRILGEERVVVFDQPGTTRDSVFVPFERDSERYTLIDTAGVRRRARVRETVEKFSVLKTLDAIERAHVVVFLIDGQEGVTDQDTGLLGHVLDSGRGLILAVNKWDGLETDQRQHVRRELDRRLPYLDFARLHFISALHGTGVGHLFESIQEAYAAGNQDLASARLTEILQGAVRNHPPPMVRGRRIKLRYAHQGGRNPLVIVVHGNQTDALPDAYRRYLAGFFQKSLGLKGGPVRLKMRTGDNPYQGRKNVLSPRQARKRKRLLEFTRRGQRR